MEAFERRWRLIELLLTGPKPRQWVLAELARLDAAERGLSGSSLSEDVALLRGLGIAFAPLGPNDKRARQSYALDFDRLPVWAGPEDAEALLAAADVLEGLNLVEAERLRALYERVPPATRERMRAPYSDRLLAPSTTVYDPQVMKSLQSATKAGLRMRIGYQPVGKPARRYLVDRAYLTWQDGGLYLHAHCPEEPGTPKVLKNREFRLDRFLGVEGHPPVEVLTGSPVHEQRFPTFELELWVAPSFAPRFQSVPGVLRVFDQDDGAKLVKVTEAIALRAVRRVLSYGDLVRVLAPEFVREDLRRIHRRMLATLEDDRKEGEA